MTGEHQICTEVGDCRHLLENESESWARLAAAPLECCIYRDMGRLPPAACAKAKHKIKNNNEVACLIMFINVTEQPAPVLLMVLFEDCCRAAAVMSGPRARRYHQVAIDWNCGQKTTRSQLEAELNLAHKGGR